MCNLHSEKAENIEERVTSGKLRFKVVCNSHFYNYFMHRSVVVVTVNGCGDIIHNIRKKELLLVS